MKEVTFLTIDQIIGSNQINIIKQYGTKSAITDFSILLDGFVLNNYHANQNFSLNNRTGIWSTKSFYNDNSFYSIDHRGCKKISEKIGRQSGGRPVLLCDNIHFDNPNSVFEFNYGEYPQTVLGFYESLELESLFSKSLLSETGKIYTVDMPHSCTSNAKFMTRDFVEFEYNNHKFIRFVSGYSYSNGNILSNGRKILPNNVYWIKVEPIIWIVDSINNIAISKKIIFAGVPFNNYDIDNTVFEESTVYKYLNNIFIKDMIPSHTSGKQLIKTRF